MAIPSDAKYSGTQGTCNWYVSQNGELVIEPMSGNSGVIYPVAFSGYPWSNDTLDEPSDISKAVLTATVKPGVTYDKSGRIGDSSNLFCGCINMTSVTAPAAFWNSLDTGSDMFLDCRSLEQISFNNASFVNSTEMSSMFYNCSSLTSLDLQSFNTANVTNIKYMFYGCDLLTTVTFGSNWTVPDDNLYLTPCMNVSTGIYCNTNSDYANLTDSEKRGTWQRFVEQTFSVTAYRSENGTADEDGSDASLQVSYAISGSETSSTLTIYQKAASESSYPSTPVVTRNLSGSSGHITVTISDIGDDAYDFRVEWSYGSVTCVAFPSIATNIHLVDIDPNGNVTVYGDLSCSNIKCGRIRAESVDANSYKDFAVIFEVPFTSTPSVTASFEGNAASIGMGYMSLSIYGISTTGFTARIYNRDAAAHQPYVQWIATSSGKQ